MSIRDKLNENGMHNYFSNIIYDDNEKKHKLGISYLPEIPTLPGDFFYSVKPPEQYRPDKVSLKFYKTPYLDWVILKANNIKNIYSEFTTGKSIIVPDPDYIISEYLKKSEFLIDE